MILRSSPSSFVVEPAGLCSLAAAAETSQMTRESQTDAMQRARASISRRLEIADTDDMLTLHEQQGGSGPTQGYNSRLVAAGRRLVVAKAMVSRLGRDSVLFKHLSLDLLVSVGCAVPVVPSLTGEWQVRGAFHHGEQYKYRMWLTEHDDGSVTGKGKFHDHPLSPTFRITRGLVSMSADADTGRVRTVADRSMQQPVLHMRQESQEFVNFCSLVLSPDRAQMLEGEWMQLDLTSDATAWAKHQAAPFTVPKPQPDIESFSTWGWWVARRAHRSEELSEQASEPEPESCRRCAPPPPGVIGTPPQWVAGAPLRRPPACISDPLAPKGRWADPDPDPTAKLGIQHRADDGAEVQGRRRQRTVDGWRLSD
jgi:hypothetical protein